MTVLALDTTPPHVNLVRLADARKARGLPAVPETLRIMHSYAPRDIVLVIGAQRRGTVISIERTDDGGQRCDVLFIEGKKGQPWRASFEGFQLSLIRRCADMPHWLPARMNATHPDHSGPAA
ncbi:MAG TPA: hypothetical protein VGO34_14745 [Alphaproteobacteria bacterium]|jgi:hypothetical protein